jgi:hypothetical protein
MNYARIKSLQQQRYSDVNERQRERNQERVNHASSILSELEKQVGDDNGRLETAKELVSLAGTETRTKGCNKILADCLKLLKRSAEDAGLGEQYQEQMREMPDETVSESPSADKYCSSGREDDRRRREPVRTKSGYDERLTNKGE